MANKVDQFLKAHQKTSNATEFWSEGYRSIFIISLERGYNPEIIQHWGISDFAINGDKVLLKWYKRLEPLSKEELKEKYGK